MTYEEFRKLKAGDVISCGNKSTGTYQEWRIAFLVTDRGDSEGEYILENVKTGEEGRASWPDGWTKVKDSDPMGPVKYVVLLHDIHAPGNFIFRDERGSYAAALDSAKRLAQSSVGRKYSVARVCTTVEVTCKEVEKVVKEKVYETQIKIHRS